MKCVIRSADTAILRFDLGEEVLMSLQAWCEAERILAGNFTAIGAASMVELSWYDTDEKRYADKLIEGKWEIVGLTGFVAQKEGLAHIHAHGSFSDEQMNLQGGHIKRMTVGATCELSMIILDGTITRSFDERTGLYLMD